MGRGRKIVAGLFIGWWLFVLIPFGLIGNIFLISVALGSGSAMGVAFLCACVLGACVYLYRTWKFRDELRSLFRD